MKFKRQLAAVGGTLALVTAGASVALVGGLSPSSAAQQPSSAYGLVATGLIPIQKKPTVTSTTGSLVTDSLVAFPSNPLLTGGLINVKAKNGYAHSDIANVSVGGGILSQLTGQLSQLTTQLQPVCDALKQVDLSTVTGAVTNSGGTLDLGGLTTVLDTVTSSAGVDIAAVTSLDLSKLLPSDLSGLCDVLSGKASLVGAGAITTECHGSTGTVNVVGLKAAGLPVSIDTTKPDQHFQIPGLLDIETNAQTTNSDGSFTVDGVVIKIGATTAIQQTIVLTSATCGYVAHRTVPTSNAPTPTPTHTRAPVTG